MIGPVKLGRRILRRVRLGRPRAGDAPIQGIPEGIARDVLEELCLQRTGSKLRRVAYRHLSGWKRAGAYRLFLENTRGHLWRLIYKNAVYELDHIPALKNFPVTPGAPEFLVYSRASGSFAEYLPEVYLCQEEIPNKHYHYLLEDLGEDFCPVCENNTTKVKFSVVEQLPAFHEAMLEWLKEVDKQLLLQYNEEYSQALRTYAGDVFAEYSKQTSSPVVQKVCEHWAGIAQLAIGATNWALERAPIHGDANGSNILIHKNNIQRIKFIDWEWAGVGMPFADIVSLFRRVDADTGAKIVAIYRENSRNQTFGDPLRLYEWCRLERAMVDAAYIASQYMGSLELEARKAGDWEPGFIENSLNTMFSAYEALTR